MHPRATQGRANESKRQTNTFKQDICSYVCGFVDFDTVDDELWPPKNTFFEKKFKKIVQFHCQMHTHATQERANVSTCYIITFGCHHQSDVFGCILFERVWAEFWPRKKCIFWTKMPKNLAEVLLLYFSQFSCRANTHIAFFEYIYTTYGFCFTQNNVLHWFFGPFECHFFGNFDVILATFSYAWFWSGSMPAAAMDFGRIFWGQ